MGSEDCRIVAPANFSVALWFSRRNAAEVVLECSGRDADEGNEDLAAGAMLLRGAGREEEGCADVDSVNTEKDSDGDGKVEPVRLEALFPKDLDGSAVEALPSAPTPALPPNLASILAWTLAGTDTRDWLSNFCPSMVRCPVDFSDSICRLASICCLCSNPLRCLSCSRALNWS